MYDEIMTSILNHISSVLQQKVNISLLSMTLALRTPGNNSAAVHM